MHSDSSFHTVVASIVEVGSLMADGTRDEKRVDRETDRLATRRRSGWGGGAPESESCVTQAMARGETSRGR